MDQIHIAVVNFTPVWGEKAANLKKMEDDINEAKEKQVDLIVFPECTLTGNDIDFEHLEHLMQKEQAESIQGESVTKIVSLAKEKEMYIVFGMPEQDEERVYNSLIVAGPKGVEAVYRKQHPFGYEGCWCEAGDTPVIWDSPWGKIGFGICFETFQFPELIRYYAAKGCRAYINISAQPVSRRDPKGKEKFRQYYWSTLEAAVIANEIFMISANETGIERFACYGGAGAVIGPEKRDNIFKDPYVVNYAGGMEFTKEGIRDVEIDLSHAQRSLFYDKGLTGKPDFRADIYKKWYSEIAMKEE